MVTIDVKYVRTVRQLPEGYEIRVSNTATFWGIFRNGQKITEFMNCRECSAWNEIRKFFSKRGITV